MLCWWLWSSTISWENLFTKLSLKPSWKPRVGLWIPSGHVCTKEKPHHPCLLNVSNHSPTRWTRTAQTFISNSLLLDYTVVMSQFRIISIGTWGPNTLRKYPSYTCTFNIWKHERRVGTSVTIFMTGTCPRFKHTCHLNDRKHWKFLNDDCWGLYAEDGEQSNCGPRYDNQTVALGMTIKLWPSVWQSNCGPRYDNQTVALGMTIKLWPSVWQSNCGPRYDNQTVALGMTIKLWPSVWQSNCGPRYDNQTVALGMTIKLWPSVWQSNCGPRYDIFYIYH